MKKSMIILILGLSLCYAPAPIYSMGSESTNSNTQAYPCDNCKRPYMHLTCYSKHNDKLECVHTLCNTCYNAIPGEFVPVAQSDINKITTSPYPLYVQQYLLNYCYYCMKSFLNNQESWFINTDPASTAVKSTRECVITDVHASALQKTRKDHPLQPITSQPMTAFQNNQPIRAATTHDTSSNANQPTRPSMITTTLNSPYVWGAAAVVGTYLVYQLYQWWVAKPEDDEKLADTQNLEESQTI